MPIKQKIKKLFQRKIKHLKLNKRICPVCGSVKRTKILNIDNWKKIDSKGNIYAVDDRNQRVTKRQLAPEILINEVINAFNARYDVKKQVVETAIENVSFKVPRILRETTV